MSSTPTWTGGGGEEAARKGQGGVSAAGRGVEGAGGWRGGGMCMVILLP